MSDDIAAYRKGVIAAHRPAFDLFAKVSGSVERTLLKPRIRPDLPALVLDMLMAQGHKAYGAVAILAQHGLMEDSATIGRRLMELGVQAIYIGAESDARLRRRKAGMYLAFLWRQLPRRVKHRLPAHVRSQWTAVGRGYGRFLPKKAKAWGPNWREMFRQIGAEPTYETDYAFLAGMAHGAAESQIFTYSQSTIRLHRHDFASILIAYATKYYLMIVEQWNGEFRGLPDAKLTDLIERAVDFRPA